MKKSVIEYLKQTVEKYSDKIAVKDSCETISFNTLLNSGYILATEILSYNMKNKPIGVYIPKGCKAVQAFAGINISGNFYVPIDTKSPDSRVLSIINILDSSIIITDKEHYDKLSASTSFYNPEESILILEVQTQYKAHLYFY